MIVKCPHCSSDFENKNGQYVRKFCSDKCKVENYRPKKRIADQKCAAKNKAKKSQYDKDRRASDPERFAEEARISKLNYAPKRWGTDKKLLESSPKHRYYKNIMTLLGKYLREGITPKYSKLIGYLPFEFDEIKNKFEHNIPEGYSWEDFVNSKLHIDHIIPHRKFNYTHHEDEEFKKCWDINNLRLLDAKTNISRKENYER